MPNLQEQDKGLETVDPAREPDARRIGKTILAEIDVDYLHQGYESGRKFENPDEEPETGSDLAPYTPRVDEDTRTSDERDDKRPMDPELDQVAGFGNRTGPSRPLVSDRLVITPDQPHVKGQESVHFQQSTSSERYGQKVSDDTRRKEGLAYYSEDKQPVTDDGTYAVAAAAVYASRVRALEKDRENHVDDVRDHSEDRKDPEVVDRNSGRAVIEEHADTGGKDHKEHKDHGDKDKDFGRTVVEVDAPTGLRTRAFLDELRDRDPHVYGHPGFRAVVLSHNADAIRASGIFDDHGDKVEVRQSSLDEPPEIPENTLFAMFDDADQSPARRVAIPEGANRRPVELPSKTYLERDDPVATAEPTSTGSSRLTRVRAQAFRTFDTASSPDARTQYAPIVSRRVFEKLRDPRDQENLDGPDSPWLSSLYRQDDRVREFMDDDDWPENITHVRHHAPELEDRIAATVRAVGPDGLVMVDARTRTSHQPIDWDKLSEQKGREVRNVVEGPTLWRGAIAADEDATVYIPPHSPDQEGRYAISIIDRSKDDALKGSSVNELERVVTNATGNQAADLLENARVKLDSVRPGDSNDGRSAVNAIIRQYNAYRDTHGITTDPDFATQLIEMSAETRKVIRGNVLPERDADLARNLARTFRRHGHYTEAIEFADKAIEIAPHVDANARVEKAKALVATGDLVETDEVRQYVFDEAWRELDAASEISPRNVDMHLARADLALRQERWSEYSAALVAIQRDAPQLIDLGSDESLHPELRSLFDASGLETDEPGAGAIAEAEAIAKLWYAKLSADEKAIEQSAADSPTIPAWIERPVKDENGSWIIKADYYENDVDATWWQRSELGKDALETASTLYRLMNDVAPNQRRQWQDRMVAPILGIAERNQPFEASGIVLTGEDAKAARDFDEARREAIEQSKGELVVYRDVERSGEKSDEQGISLTLAVLDPADVPYADLDILFEDLEEPGFIQGQVKSGKTTLAQRLGLEFAKNGKQVWFWDLGKAASHGDLPEVMGDAAQVTHIRFGDKNFPLAALAVMEPEPGYDLQDHIDDLINVLQFGTSAEEPYPQLIRRAVQKAYAKYGNPVRGSDGQWMVPEMSEGEARYPTFAELYDILMEETEIYEGGEVAGNVRGFLKARFGEFASGKLGAHVGNQSIIDFADLLQNAEVVHLDFSHVGTMEQRNLLAAIVDTKLMQRLKVMREDDGDRDPPLRGIHIREEAQTYLGTPDGPESPDAKRVKIMAEDIRQQRRFGFTTIALVQDIQQVLPDFTKNSKLKVMLHTEDPESRAVVLDGTTIRRDNPDFDKPASFPKGKFMVSMGKGYPLTAQISKNVHHDNTLPYRPFTVRKGYDTADGTVPSRREVDEAERDLLLEKYALWSALPTVVTLAKLTGNQLPSVPAEMQRQYDEMPERKRALMMQIAAKNAVRRRADALRYDAGQLEASVEYDVVRLLHGVPIGGHDPGTGLIADELTSALWRLRLKDPFADTPPDPKTPIYLRTQSIRGLDRALSLTRQGDMAGHSSMPLADQVQQGLERVATTVGSNVDHEAHNQARAITQLLGSKINEEKRIFQLVTHNERDMSKRWVQVAEEFGLRRPGDPRPSWLEEVMNLPERAIWFKKVDANQRARAEAGMARLAVERSSLPEAPEPSEAPAPSQTIEDTAAAPQVVTPAAAAVRTFNDLRRGDMGEAINAAVKIHMAHLRLRPTLLAEKVGGDTREAAQLYAQALFDKLVEEYNLSGANGVEIMLSNL